MFVFIPLVFGITFRGSGHRADFLRRVNVQQKENISAQKQKQSLARDIIEERELSHRRYARARQGESKPEPLTPAEQARLEMLTSKSLSSLKGKSEYSEVLRFEDHVRENLKLTREQIRSAKKNPLVAQLLKTIGIILGLMVLTVALLVLSSVIEDAVGEIGKTVAFIASGISGMVSLTMASAMISSIRSVRLFRKLQKAYGDPGFWENLVDVQAWKEIRQQLAEQDTE